MYLFFSIYLMVGNFDVVTHINWTQILFGPPDASLKGGGNQNYILGIFGPHAPDEGEAPLNPEFTGLDCKGATPFTITLPPTAL